MEVEIAIEAVQHVKVALLEKVSQERKREIGVFRRLGDERIPYF